MVRWIGGLVGLGFVAAVLIGLISTVSDWIANPPAETAPELVRAMNKANGGRLLEAGLSSEGSFGTFDKRQLQRGYQVYREVCSACHSIRLVAFRDLAQLGYSTGQVKTLAATWDTIPSVNEDTGEASTRKGMPSDHFPLIFANDTAARAANGGAIPPDLSDMVKAREDGANYIYSLVGHGYGSQPKALLAKFPDATTPKGRYFNKYFSNLNIAMPPPLKQDGQVQYADGTKSTVDQNAKDIAAFLTWTAEPKLETRHAAGFGAVAFALIFCFLAWGAYQNVWRDVKH
ncbi:cytochrome c1 [Sphingomonas bacterium]|uniref:cytochrome c1 n=1 Tax=Sphingomonas bacterium TaxID=1895847 RepID=UPI00157513F4|nr:cytochrome c1 [Sphingomonas bacterium]